MRIRLFASAFVAFALASPALRADVQHTVARGHTIEAIAARYKVTQRSIIEANKLKDADHLKVGDVLTIPKVDPPPSSKAKIAKREDKDDRKDPRASKAEKASYAQKPKTPGVIHVRRIATTEEQDIRLAETRGGRVSAGALKTLEKMLRSPAGPSHPIDARLVSLLGVVSNHFGSRKIEVVSGFRPYTPSQYTHHSNHNHGKAVDFRIPGVPNEVVRDYCRTLRNVGCGYYPNGIFVHMDVRDTSAFWIDYSKPGEPPRYNAANVEADEGTSDVQEAPRGAASEEPPPVLPSSEAPAENEIEPLPPSEQKAE